ncbi:MAG: nucleotidyltransferase family protein [Candidatus Marinimicrobia bacterium]|nr:nucleotidyltransferase family protein [Candidatus Neomarinimicrobiota bacterium]
MKNMDEIIKILTEHKEELKEKYKIKEIKIFGSYARGEQTETSDIDIIVDFEETPTLIELLRVEEEIERILGIKVDLLTEESISPFIKPYIKEVVAI